MGNRKWAFSTVIIILVLNGCKKKGCTDSLALNYDESAVQNDQSCEYTHLTYEKSFGTSGTEIGEYNLQDGNTWNGSFATDGSSLFIKDVHNNRVQRLNASLEEIDWFGYYDGEWGFHTADTAGIDSMKPQNIYFQDGFLYITQMYFGNKILKVDLSSGELVQRFTLGQDFASFAVDQSGSIYASNYVGHTISKYSNTGSLVNIFSSFGSDNGELSTIGSEMKIDSNGDLLIFDSQESRIQKFNSDGEFILKWGVPGDFSTRSFDLVNDLVYIEGEGVLYEYTSSGLYIRQWNLAEEHISNSRFTLFNNKLITEHSYDDNFMVFGFSGF